MSIIEPKFLHINGFISLLYEHTGYATEKNVHTFLKRKNINRVNWKERDPNLFPNCEALKGCVEECLRNIEKELEKKIVVAYRNNIYLKEFLD